jgi:hypothetical protein
MKKRLKEMEDEAAALREMQAKVEKEMGSVQGDSILSPFGWRIASFFDTLLLFFNAVVIIRKENFDVFNNLISGFCLIQVGLNW